MENKDYYRVNWIDGMKINKDHFIEMENAFIKACQVIGAQDINATNYGLLPYLGKENAVDMALSIDGQDTLKVVLNRCRAVTKGGIIIDISKAISSALEKQGTIIKADYKIDSSKTDKEYYVVLSVDPHVRIPFGDTISGEEPPRHPYVLPKYVLAVVDFEAVNESEFGDQHITIGKIMFKDEKFILDPNFVPPCISVQSHQDLKFLYQSMNEFFNTLEKYVMTIIQKIYQKRQSNDLADMVKTIAQNILQYVATILPELRLCDQHHSPVVLITKLMGLARITKNSVDVYIGTGKEELLNYLSDWSNFKQGELESTLVKMIELQYQHTDINKALGNISEYTKLMLVLFKTLSELDYIGKKSDSNIFVKEEIIGKDEVKNRRSFLLD